MSNLSIFKFKSNQVRVILIEGQLWFVAKDVCEVLEVGNPSRALMRLDDDEKGITSSNTLGGGQNLSVISESGFYSLVLSSRKPQARPFKKWVTSQVLPTIHRTGSYSINQQQSSPLPPAKQQIPFWYQRLVLDGTKNKGPVGYFTIFREVVDLVRDLEANGYVLKDSDYPDISVGQCWANHLRKKGIIPDQIRTYYLHHYPDGRIVEASAYTNQYLAEFRDWFNWIYCPQKLPKYLGDKDKSSLPALERMLDLKPGTLAITAK
jgi:prophage antirepressor-like protein